MSKMDDTFEMLDDTPQKSKKSLLLIVILVLLIMGGISTYLQKQTSNQASPVATMSEPLQKDTPVPTQLPAAPAATKTEVVNFNLASAVLTSDQKEKLKVFYNSIKNMTGTIQIDGYTDNLGLAEEGVILSRQRAEAVATYLKSLGISDNLKLNLANYGENNPVGDNSSETGRQQNRRVELKFTPAP